MPPTSRVATAVFALVIAGACTSPPSTSGPQTRSAAATTSTATAAEEVAELPEVLPDPRERTLSEVISLLLSEKHLVRRPIDDTVSKEAFPKYLEQLDGAKLLLLQSDVAALSKMADRMDDQLKEGDLSLGRKGTALVGRRRVVVAKAIAEILQSPLDFSVAEELETDPEKRAYCATEEDLRTRWRQVLKLQVLERIQQMEDLLEAQAKGKVPDDPAAKRLLTEIPPTLEGKEQKARKELATRFEARFVRLAKTEPLEPAEQFFGAITAVYDPHTVYMAPAERENFDIGLSGKLEGIGAALGEQDHYVVVREVIPGGASWQQGKLGAGDVILAVAQDGKDAVDVVDMPLDRVVGMIRGPKGTIVTLTVKKPEGHVETISITRDVIKIESAYARGAVLDLGEKHDPQGYVYLPAFYGDIGGGPKKPGDRNATDDVRALLAQFQQRKIGGVIIDLRGNGGGLLSHARDISGLFIPNGPIVQTRESDGKIEVLEDDDPSVAFTGDVVVLVDRFSASAAEIVAGALQDYERAVIVGTSATHGKGTVQALIELDRFKEKPGGESLGGLKITLQQYFRVKGGSTQWRGVTPDVLLPDPASFVDSGERTLFHSIPWTSVEPASFTRSSHAWSLPDLVAKSAARVKAHPTLTKVDAFGRLVRARRQDTTEPLQRDAYLAEKRRDKAALDAADPKLADQKPLLDVQILGVPPPKPAGDKGKGAGKGDDWKTELERDPWVEESLRVLADMRAKK